MAVCCYMPALDSKWCGNPAETQVRGAPFCLAHAVMVRAFADTPFDRSAADHTGPAEGEPVWDRMGRARGPRSVFNGSPRGEGYGQLCGRRLCFNMADMEAGGTWFCSPECADQYQRYERERTDDERDLNDVFDHYGDLYNTIRDNKGFRERAQRARETTTGGYDDFRRAAHPGSNPAPQRDETAWVATAFAGCPERYREKLFGALAKAFHPDTGGDDATMRAILAQRKATTR